VGVGDSCAFRLSFDFDRNFASTSFEVARSIDRALATLALLIALFRLFGAAVFLRAALTGLFAAPCARTAVPPAELLRFRFESFDISLFIFSRIALRTTRTLDAGLLLPSRFRAPDEGAFATRFLVDFALDAGPAFFVFDFVVFFDLLRAVIVRLSTRKSSRTRTHYRAPTTTALQKQHADSLLTSPPRTPGGFRSVINSSFSTKSSKNQRGR